MRRSIDVVLIADAVVASRLPGATALVIDVLRASTSIISALANGAAGVIPVETVSEARARKVELGGTALLAGERGGDPPEGFDLGNSPLEFTNASVGGRTVVLTTSNGTRALLASRPAAVVGVAAFVNAAAAVAWAHAREDDVVLVCAGDLGASSLEDQACAGLLAARLSAADPDARLTPAATAARALGIAYGKDLERLARDAPHARGLIAKGRGADVAACFVLDTSTMVPVLLAGVDKLVSGPR